jgi:hypothetical protein
MPNFDVSREWVVLAPPDIPAARKGAEDIVRCIGLLRRQAGLFVKPPLIADALGPAPPEQTPLIVFNCENGGRERNGFTWRAGAERIEIYGESDRGLCKGIYDFLSKLGIQWPEPGKEELPPPMADRNGGYALAVSGAYEPSGWDGKGPPPWRRFFTNGKDSASPKIRASLIQWAARNKYDAFSISLKELPSRRFRAGRTVTQKLAGEYALILEAGGRELSLLVPRTLFFFHRDLFRMEEGKRKQKYNFCPTHPDTIKAIKTEGEKYFRSAKGIEVFHLWPDRGGNAVWCSCPTCRAFSPAEQNRIAVNAAADVLAAVKPGALISYLENSGEGGDIRLRQNLFKLEEDPEPAAGE